MQEIIRDVCLIPGLGKSSGGGHGNPLQYSCLENPRDRGAYFEYLKQVVSAIFVLLCLAYYT